MTHFPDSVRLNNRVYLGEAVHKGTAYSGEHDAIVSRELWDRAHEVLQEPPRTRAAQTRAITPALLKGLIFGPDGVAMSPTHTRKRGRLYRYYVSQSVVKRGAGACPISRVSAAEIETAVVDQMRGLLRQPEFIVGTWRAICDEQESMNETEIRAALERLDPLWEELFPAEQAQVARLMIRRVDVRLDGIDISFRVEGLARIVHDLKPMTEQRSGA